MQAVESLRLQLPRGLASALLCLRQLRLHYAVLLEREKEQPITKVNAGWRLAHCASFARLTVAQSSEPDFAAALSRSGASRRIPALAVVVQLERCIQSQGDFVIVGYHFTCLWVLKPKKEKITIFDPIPTMS